MGVSPLLDNERPAVLQNDGDRQAGRCPTSRHFATLPLSRKVSEQQIHARDRWTEPPETRCGDFSQ